MPNIILREDYQFMTLSRYRGMDTKQRKYCLDITNDCFPFIKTCHDDAGHPGG